MCLHLERNFSHVISSDSHSDINQAKNYYGSDSLSDINQAKNYYGTCKKIPKSVTTTIRLLSEIKIKKKVQNSQNTSGSSKIAA